jgi:hypothetical protein
MNPATPPGDGPYRVNVTDFGGVGHVEKLILTAAQPAVSDVDPFQNLINSAASWSARADHRDIK